MGKRILVVDDDPIAVRLVEYILKKRGYQVLTTSNGLDGLLAAQKERPDLVILNVMLPGIDGFEVCRRLRADKQAIQPIILILSGKAQPADIANGLNMGADDYLTKPAAPSEIINKVESLLARKAGANSKTIIFIGSKEKIGTTTIVVNLAVALSQTGKRTFAVDFSPHEFSIAGHLGIRTRSSDRRGQETAPAIHESGVNVLRVRQPPVEAEDVAAANIEFPLDRYKASADYFLVDLPFQPTPMNSILLSKCDLAMIVSDSTTEALTGVKSMVTVLRFLGIPLKRIGALITDPYGTFSQKELPNIKSYIEPNIAVSIWGIIPYESDAVQTFSSGSQPVMLSSPDCPMSASIKELAQHITSAEITKNDAVFDTAKRI
jgi:DNA-binding response OmpR family regulator